ncbi:hypothetical protein BSKO_06705 [Bryopsis sp. KO-2023]|nr:hypothetical protein BSKO_06705 [Bryopsis sp. KO-2023]
MVDSESERVKHFKEIMPETEKSRRKGLEEFKPQPTDVFVVTPPKCGTTWMQQIVHGLRSGGSMDYDCIENVIPYIEMAHDCGYTDLDKDQGYFPRMYKTHSWYPHCPKGAAKYVFVLRDPEAAGISFYHFFNGWLFDKDTLLMEEFLLGFYTALGPAKSILENASTWDIISSWYPHRNDSNVLWLHYEDMLDDLPQCVEMVSKFIGIGEGDAELLDLVVKQSRFDFMKSHWEKFDERPMKTHFNWRWNRPSTAGTDGQNSKIREGGRAKVELSEALKEKFDLKWHTTIKPVTGYASYKELREGINKELGRKFSVQS